jgi:hypothetical protein
MLSSLATADVWAVVVLVTAPTALVCGTVIVLVLAVGRRNRVEVIKALPPLLHALASQAGSIGRHARGEIRRASGRPGIGRTS